VAMVDWLRQRNQGEADPDRQLWREPPPEMENRSPLAELGGLDVVRVLPPSRRFDWPGWWRVHHQNRWRVACLAYEPSGLVSSIHARSVIDDGRESKTRWPSAGPGSASGLILAGAHGAAWLRGRTEHRILWILEGITDLIAAELVCLREGLTEIVCLSGAAGGFGSFGLIGHLSRLDSVYVRTDDDEAGNRYAEKLAQVIPREVRMYRLPWDEGGHDG